MYGNAGKKIRYSKPMIIGQHGDWMLCFEVWWKLMTNREKKMLQVLFNIEKQGFDELKVKSMGWTIPSPPNDKSLMYQSLIHGLVAEWLKTLRLR